MLAGDGPSSRILYHALLDEVEIARVVLEKPVPPLVMIRRRIRRLGLLTTAGQLLFILVNRLLSLRSRGRIEQLIRRYGLKDLPFDEGAVQRVESVNRGDVTALIEELVPDAVVVNGTRILSKDVLSSTAVPFLNTHMGITPRYRGVHGAYWALANEDAAHCGVTVHLVDEGIDTGGVLYQDLISIESSDDFNTYPIHQIAKAVPLMKAALSDVVEGRVRPWAGVGPSRLWSHPTLFAYVRNRIVAGVR